MRTMKIDITGFTRSGKTTVARMIAHQLETYGVRVTLKDEPSSPYDRTLHEEILKRSLAQELDVSIEVHQTPRNTRRAPLKEVLLHALANARDQILTLGSPTDEVNLAHVRELEQALARAGAEL